MVESAKAASYRVEGVYISTDSPEINAERIDHRVKTNTGHHADADRLPERYRFPLSNLRKTAELFDAHEVVDNSDHDEERHPFPKEPNLRRSRCRTSSRSRPTSTSSLDVQSSSGRRPVVDLHTFLPGEVTHPLTTKGRLRSRIQ